MRTVEKLIALCRQKGHTVSVAESCTGGLLAGILTSVPGSSAVFMGGVVAYDNAVKQSMLGVKVEVLQRDGAVSETTAEAMALGVRKKLNTTFAMATTGIAGPSGGSRNKPVGLVYIAVAGPQGHQVQRHVFSGDRAVIRRKACHAAIKALLSYIEAVKVP